MVSGDSGTAFFVVGDLSYQVSTPITQSDGDALTDVGMVSALIIDAAGRD
jgi:hypothetical protein